MPAGDPRTPMAWQHRDLNYHQSGYQDRYGPGAEGCRMGPPSTSDRTDKSWTTQRDSAQPLLTTPYNVQPAPSQALYVPKDYPGSSRGDYPPPSGSRDYPSTNRDPQQYPHHSRDPQYSHSRDLSPSDQYHHQGPQHQDSRHSATATSTISSSSSEEDSDQQSRPLQAPMQEGQAYGYTNGGYYPGYPPSQVGYPLSAAPAGAGGYPHYHHHQQHGTMKSAKSVPALLAATYDGEPCPVHHNGMFMPSPGPPMSMPPMIHPGYAATLGQHRRAASIYDMRIMSPPPPPTIYGTLPHHLPPPPPPPLMPSDARSVVGSVIIGPAAPGAPIGIPTQLLPPMARPRPVVIGEGGNPEVLPVRGGNDKMTAIQKSLLGSKAGSVATADDEGAVKKAFCYRGGMCVAWIILGVIVVGVLLTLMLLFIL